MSAAAEEAPSWYPSRYGAGDEAGALNEITAAGVVRAAGQLNHLRIGDRSYNGFSLDDIAEEWGT